MSLSIQSRQGRVSGSWLVRKWRDWQHRRRSLAEIDCCGRAEVGRLAGDVGVSRTEFRVLAGKWPDSVNLVSQRLEQVALDPTDIKQAEPNVLRDLQRACSLCASKRRCKRDLARNSLIRPGKSIAQMHRRFRL